VTARATVTGIGVVAPNGVGTEAYWSATLAGTSGIDKIVRFDPAQYPCQLAGAVTGFDPPSWLPSRLIAQTDLWTQFALAATTMALDDAGLDLALVPEFEIGVVTASSSGGNEFGQREIQRLWSQGPQFVGAYQSIAWFYAASTGQISIRHGARGACGVVVTEQASGLDALGQARRAVRSEAQLVISGGTEAPLSPYAFACQLANGRLSDSDDPRTCYVPFSAGARGHVPGEGGAVLIVENGSSARARGTPVYGEIAGYAAGFDPPPGSARPPALARTIGLALADAGIEPREVDVVFADAAALPSLDRAEATALTEVFGPRAVAVTAPKTMVGRLYSGGAALDVATALLALRDQIIPPTTGVDAVSADYDIDLVRDEARPAPLRTALIVARGFGGFNAAVVVAAGARRPVIQQEDRCENSRSAT
jgi:minimal PKS chain-length factor (CLF/KS beta)